MHIRKNYAYAKQLCICQTTMQFVTSITRGLRYYEFQEVHTGSMFLIIMRCGRFGNHLTHLLAHLSIFPFWAVHRSACCRSAMLVPKV